MINRERWDRGGKWNREKREMVGKVRLREDGGKVKWDIENSNLREWVCEIEREKIEKQTIINIESKMWLIEMKESKDKWDREKVV